MISFVVAVDKNFLIGKNNRLPWPNISADMKHFRELTIGKKIVMGRKTFESIGKPLPGRENFVLTSDVAWSAENVIALHSPQEVLQLADPFVIGGTKVFEEMIPYADVIYLTRIEESFEGDVYFKKEWLEKFELADSSETKDEKTGLKLMFEEWRKK